MKKEDVAILVAVGILLLGSYQSALPFNGEGGLEVLGVLLVANLIMLPLAIIPVGLTYWGLKQTGNDKNFWQRFAITVIAPIILGLLTGLYL